MTHIALVGNPNCGKTTLFNALTGDNQKVGNWPGVTVEKKTGSFVFKQKEMIIIDLPGIYSLSVSGNSVSLDEQIAAEAIFSSPIDLIINVVDACHLERHLYLTSQLLERGKPMIIALNMTDIAADRGICIDRVALEKELSCPVVVLQAHKKIGIDILKQEMITVREKAHPLSLCLPPSLEDYLQNLSQLILKRKALSPDLARYYAIRTLEGDTTFLENDKIEHTESDHWVPTPMVPSQEELDIVLADARYQKIHQVVGSVQIKKSDASMHFTARLDRIVLHRFWALPIFLTVMYTMFLFAINIGGAFQDFFDISTNTLFVNGPASFLSAIHAPSWIIALIANGLGVGINTTLTFTPVIAAMFFFLAFLEISGYMARAAFVVDKIMRLLGLPGKSFVPMIVGFGCNVPGIMAARTLDSNRDRLLTILMSPFMSCSARLAIYAVFVAAFFPTGGQNVVFSLYMIGILMAVFTGFILQKTGLGGEPSPLVLELPAYHRPTLERLLKETASRLTIFIKRAARMIIPVCIILGGLNALTIDGGVSEQEASIHSVLSYLGQWLTPLFSPMGLTPDNWPATVGLMTGMLAKEVVIGSLNTLYAQLGHVSTALSMNFDFKASMMAAFWSIPHNLAELGGALLNPILASAPDSEVSQSVYGMMVNRFDGRAGAYAYLLFILLYIPCVSTMAVIRQEASRQWMYFSLAWSLLLAYVMAVLFYQIARFWEHPQESLFWIFAMVSALGVFIGLLRYWGLSRGVNHVATNS